MQQVPARAARRSDSTGRTMPGDLAASPFRADRDRISASAFFARLGGVTQVVSPSGSGLLLHNRLTHSLKVAQVARAIAERLLADPVSRAKVEELGGLDLDVVEAAGLGHDLGHPPFGHLGESVLDRLARERFALPDGFEGNAQTYRVVTRIDVRGTEGNGLDLTAAVRAALLKYPWTRHSAVPHEPERLPRGASEPAELPGTGAAKFSAYSTELDDLVDARTPFDKTVPEWQQTVEASVMDTADDIAYAIHDLEDFHRVGILQFTTVHHELQEWLGRCVEFAAEDEVRPGDPRPGASLELLRRRLHDKDDWIADDEAFAAAVKKVRTDLAINLLERPFDRSQQAEQTVVRFSGDWTRRLVEGVRVETEIEPRSGHVSLKPDQWHEVQVLKFVHRHFVLQRPDLALHQRGQDRLISNLVEALDGWLVDEAEVAPHRLRDLLDLARQEFDELPAALLPEGVAVSTLARGRAVIDFVASLTDDQAAALLEALSGRTTQLWNDTFVL
ncbi:deoxyguanosinetriphosphate triphosphohydrolase family protein [Saccharopolyspora sp. ID03-671]|uniref:deoxyguanosinetriphosphate triphosphohydrolase family protein n=1 Tax=Saccharopolyspora sp. ID03-671 TaxID=3073066 RepID=UPI0038739B92